MPLEGTMMQTVDIRTATLDDAPVFRRVFELASEGLAPWVWEQSAGPEKSVEEIALERMRDKLDKAAPGTCFVAEVDGQAAGGIITYDIGDIPEEIEEDTPGVFVPLIELENLAPRTHYINALAVFPEFQGRGLGRKLLRQVFCNALENGMSLIAEDGNAPALSLYASEGFAEAARRPIVEAEGWQKPGENWLLMLRPTV